MSVGPDHLQRPPGGFVRPLLRARDWQDRPEFGDLCQWWKDGGVGVCALVGIGGAGKTAIAERFLQVMPGGYPDPTAPKDRSLPTPTRLFVFSFDDAPNPDTLFNELAAWLAGRSVDDSTEVLSYHQILDLLSGAGRCLLVLDGLEKVQDDGSLGGALRQILDGRLRELVRQVADGLLPGSLVITSRNRFSGSVGERHLKQIEVGQLKPNAAVRLLRSRGVRGGDDRLEDMARVQGFHALSLDLVGSYIAGYYKPVLTVGALPATVSTTSVFVCYAHVDNQPPRRWLDRLLLHLSPLVRQGDLAIWSDQRLEFGDDWQLEIQRQLAAAKVAVLFVSGAFLASRYIADGELPVLLRRAHENDLRILPVLLSPSLFHLTRFKWPDPKAGPEEFTLTSLQAAGAPSKTLSEMTRPRQDRVFVALAERILEIVGANP